MAGLGGECDFVADVALTVPLRVIMEILGVPAVDEPRMLKLTQELFQGHMDSALNRSQERLRMRSPRAPRAYGDPAGGDRRFLPAYFKGRSRRRSQGPIAEELTWPAVIANSQIDWRPDQRFQRR